LAPNHAKKLDGHELPTKNDQNVDVFPSFSPPAHEPSRHVSPPWLTGAPRGVSHCPQWTGADGCCPSLPVPRLCKRQRLLPAPAMAGKAMAGNWEKYGKILKT